MARVRPTRHRQAGTRMAYLGVCIESDERLLISQGVRHRQGAVRRCNAVECHGEASLLLVGTVRVGADVDQKRGVAAGRRHAWGHGCERRVVVQGRQPRVSLAPVSISGNYSSPEQTPPMHRPLTQSTLAAQKRPGKHRSAHGPPQSMSPSLPFATPSAQVGAATTNRASQAQIAPRAHAASRPLTSTCAALTDGRCTVRVAGALHAVATLDTAEPAAVNGAFKTVANPVLARRSRARPGRADATAAVACCRASLAARAQATASATVHSSFVAVLYAVSAAWRLAHAQTGVTGAAGTVSVGIARSAVGAASRACWPTTVRARFVVVGDSVVTRSFCARPAGSITYAAVAIPARCTRCADETWRARRTTTVYVALAAVADAVRARGGGAREWGALANPAAAIVAAVAAAPGSTLAHTRPSTVSAGFVAILHSVTTRGHSTHR